MTSESDLEWEEWNPKKLTFLQHMIAGSIAGLAEHISTFPLDTLKTNIQCERCGSTSLFQTWQCASKIVRNEGIFRLWRGVSAMFAGCVPAHAVYFSVFEMMKLKLGVNNNGHYPLQSAFIGASAVFGHDVCMNPFDVVKQRMQLGYYNNVSDCVRQIFIKEGLLGFYVSLPTTLIMNIPYGCIMIPINESTRRIIDPSGNYSVQTLLLSGSIAGAVAAFFTTPLDVIKTRLQTQNLEPCPRISTGNVVVSPRIDIQINSSSNLNSFWKSITSTKLVILSIIKSEGYLGFLRGGIARTLVQAPGVGISWTVYETVKNWLSLKSIN